MSIDLLKTLSCIFVKYLDSIFVLQWVNAFDTRSLLNARDDTLCKNESSSFFSFYNVWHYALIRQLERGQRNWIKDRWKIKLPFLYLMEYIHWHFSFSLIESKTLSEIIMENTICKPLILVFFARKKYGSCLIDLAITAFYCLLIIDKILGCIYICRSSYMSTFFCIYRMMHFFQ